MTVDWKKSRPKPSSLGNMSRLWERLIDLLVLVVLLWFAREMRLESPEIAGMIVAGAVQFWMTKNASSPHSPDPSVIAAQVAAAQLVTNAASAAAKLQKAGDVGVG